jgi:hypothetical protein
LQPASNISLGSGEALEAALTADIAVRDSVTRVEKLDSSFSINIPKAIIKTIIPDEIKRIEPDSGVNRFRLIIIF